VALKSRWDSQLLALAGRVSEPPARSFNPRPPGVIRRGSATHLVLVHLRSQPGFVRHHQLRIAVDRSPKAIDWALVFLRSRGLIEAVPDGLHSRYLRYRAKPGVPMPELGGEP
jgi:hypothetical protein